MKNILIILLAFFAIGCKAQIYLGSAYKFGQYIIVKDSVTSPFIHCDSLRVSDIHIWDNVIGTTDNVPLSFRVNNVKSGEIDCTLNNISFGCLTLFSNTIGNSNTAMGWGSLYSNIHGDNNTGYGIGSLYYNKSGDENTAIGGSSLGQDTSGKINTAIGTESLFSNLNGNYNIGVGHYAGFYADSLNKWFYINSLDRGSITGDTTMSIICGRQDGTLAAQRLKLNARVQIPILTGSLTDGAPTAAEINGIVGFTAARYGAGVTITIKDTDGSGLLYKIESDGSDWYYVAMTKAL